MPLLDPMMLNPLQGMPAMPGRQQAGMLNNGLGGFGGWLNDNSNTLLMLGAGLAGGRNLGEGIGRGLQLAAEGRKTDTTRRNQNMTEQALLGRGLDPDTARLVAGNPELLQTILKNELGGGQTDDIREYQFAKQQGFGGSFEEWTQRKRAGAGEYGLTPIWGVNDKNEPVMLQPGKSGTAIQSVLPPGVKLARNPIKVEGPTGTWIYDPQTREQIQFIPKDVAGAASATATGKGQGEAGLVLPQVKTTVDNAIQTIDKLRKHPGLDTATGTSSVFDPRNYMPGTNAYDFHALNQQAQGQAFMAAREALKGAGQVTDFEGRKGEQAIANLNAAQSKEQYLAALDNLERLMKLSYDNLLQKAGRGPAANDPLGLR